jgi:hypothetical protein
VISVLGLDGNPWTTRDMDATGANFVKTMHKLGFSGSYTTGVGGDTLDLSGVAGNIPSGFLPLAISVNLNGSTGSFSVTGGQLQIAIGTTLKNNKVLVFSSGNTEQGSGTYASILLNVAAEDVIIEVIWRKLQP